ncbi:MAG: serine hydrolase [Chloroflexi bacterium]|nr:serine hydrolase [Chloroflexota bacterium]
MARFRFPGIFPRHATFSFFDCVDFIAGWLCNAGASCGNGRSPANQRTNITTLPDPYRQTTITDLTQLMGHLYTCVEQNSGLLREAYGDQLTQSECQELLQMMQLNELARLFENGLLDDTIFTHKVGWIDDTYGDVGIVYDSERDFLIRMALYTPEWLE